MGIHFLEIPTSKRIYVCKVCDTPLAKQRDIISDNFFGRAGAAYLMRKAYNLKHDVPESREMRTGMHTVRDVYCKICYTYRRRTAKQMGWYYEFAFQDSQRYKEGRIILEKRLLKEIVGVDENNPVYKPGKTGAREIENSENENSENSENQPENPENEENQENRPRSSSENTDDSSENSDEDDEELSEGIPNLMEPSPNSERSSARPDLISASRMVMPWERRLSSDDIHQRNFLRFGRMNRNEDEESGAGVDEENEVNWRERGFRPETTIQMFADVQRRRHNASGDN